MSQYHYGEKRGPTVFERLRSRRNKKSQLTLGEQFKDSIRGPRARVDGGKSNYANAVGRRVAARAAKNKPSGFTSVLDLAKNPNRSKRERNFATSQRGEINRRFGGDVNKALAAMRREAARQKARR